MSAARRRRGRGQDKTGRSKGEGQYMNLPYRMVQSAAWRSLSGAAVKVWLELRTRFHGSNNGDLHVSYGEAAELLGMSRSSVGRAFEELQVKGFVVKTRQGHFYRSHANEWRVTDLKYGTENASRDWEAWLPEEVRTIQKTKHGSRNEPLCAPIDPPEYRGPKK